ncbi:hypothetical protein [Novosphingobium kaempferiae]|uniref:hypothetical protein n=1 Tax=Novosphingobium kaempferiae TaxID=2896849 RepID=UPI001E4D0621|nr:hypothetical protein [Novosphingobium kaempferiae]
MDRRSIEPRVVGDGQIGGDRDFERKGIVYRLARQNLRGQGGHFRYPRMEGAARSFTPDLGLTDLHDAPGIIVPKWANLLKILKQIGLEPLDLWQRG